jgi:tripartite-type tricarboxylate transporter receptor subunit TctC
MFEKCVARVREVLGVLLVGTALLSPLTVHAQPYPNRLIKIIVPYAAGGAVDIVARAIGQPLAEALKQPVIVDNRPGASANIGM